MDTNSKLLVFKGFKFSVSSNRVRIFLSGIGFLITDVKVGIVLNCCTGTFDRFYCGNFHRGFTTYYFYLSALQNTMQKKSLCEEGLYQYSLCA